MGHVDLTERAIAGGWTLPDGWTVTAESWHDDAVQDIGKEFDCYSDEDITAWCNSEWWIEGITVSVQDDAGRDWGVSSVGGFEAGQMPGVSEWLDPLEDKPAHYSPIREHDMIGEALREAVKALESFGSPVLTEPTGVNYSGL
jgi:hypothetical protein